MITWTFLLTAFVIVATPGTGAVYSIVAGLSRGRNAGVLAHLLVHWGLSPTCSPPSQVWQPLCTPALWHLMS